MTLLTAPSRKPAAIDRIGLSESQAIANAMPVAARVARAESAYKRAQKEREAEEAKAEQERLKRHARSQQQAQEAHRALASPHRSLALALAWFREEWTAATPARVHAANVVDEMGAPQWTERYRTWLMEVDWDDPARPRDPLRMAHVAMRASESLFDKYGAEYLFRVACMGWDLLSAATVMDPPIAVPYVAWYAEKAIDRLREKVELERHRPAPKVDRPEWMDRLGIGRSEAQANAEEAA